MIRPIHKLVGAVLALAWVIGLALKGPQANWPLASAESPATSSSEKSTQQSVALSSPAAKRSNSSTGPLKFDGARAYEHLKEICSLGPRISGSPGMLQQQELLQRHFRQLGAEVSLQSVPAKRHPLTRQVTPLTNLIVQWQPAAKQRILLCAHYDTRPLPEQDPDRRQRQQGVFLGANDGASGVALLMELGRCVTEAEWGVDFVFFDAEEFVVGERMNDYFLGSKHFARNYRQNPPPFRYVAGALLDMVGDANLQIRKEAFSANWSDTRPVVEEIWEVARQLKVIEFVDEVGLPIQDDHLPLRQIGGIPVCDVIDFQYPDESNRYWHTTADTPENCSGDSLGKVGRVMEQWLKNRQ